MSEEKNETLADKAKAQIDALKTQEGRYALQEKVRKGLISATTTVKIDNEAISASITSTPFQSGRGERI